MASLAPKHIVVFAHVANQAAFLAFLPLVHVLVLHTTMHSSYKTPLAASPLSLSPPQCLAAVEERLEVTDTILVLHTIDWYTYTCCVPLSLDHFHLEL